MAGDFWNGRQFVSTFPSDFAIANKYGEAGVSMSTFALLPQEAKKVKLEYQKKLKSYSPSSWFEMMY